MDHDRDRDRDDPNDNNKESKPAAPANPPQVRSRITVVRVLRSGGIAANGNGSRCARNANG